MDLRLKIRTWLEERKKRLEKRRELRAAMAEQENRRLALLREWSNKGWSVDQPVTNDAHQTKLGPKGGRYTEAVTKHGRRYRRYF